MGVLLTAAVDGDDVQLVAEDIDRITAGRDLLRVVAAAVTDLHVDVGADYRPPVMTTDTSSSM